MLILHGSNRQANVGVVETILGANPGSMVDLDRGEADEPVSAKHQEAGEDRLYTATHAKAAATSAASAATAPGTARIHRTL